MAGSLPATVEVVGWLRNLFRAASVQADGGRLPEPSVTFSHDIPTPIDDLISQTGADISAAPVPRDKALQVPAVLRGRNLVCSLSTLPLVTRDRDRVQSRTSLLDQIDPNVPNLVTLAQTFEDLVFEGISWWRITDRSSDGFPRSAMHLDVSTVSMTPPARASQQRLRTLPSQQQLPAGVVWVHGEPVDGRNMIRFDSPNPGILKAAARSIRRAIVFDRAAAMYATDPRAQEYFTPAENADPIEDDEVEEILEEWRAARRERATAYVPASLKYNSVDMPSPADLQLVELQKQAVIEIANALGIDSEDLQVSTTSRTYANATDRRRDRINDTLSPYMLAITERLSMNDITKRGYRVEFDLDDYMRADPTTRWNNYQTGLSNNVLSVQEVREMEGLPAVPVEQTPQGRQPRQQGQDTQTDQQEAGMSRTTRVDFTEDSSAVVTFDLSDADAEFRVDAEKRTVSGLIVPWNKVARSGFAKYRFGPDSLSYSRASRVKLNRDHDRTQAVGYATELTSTPQGLQGTFKIARGGAGDEVLSLAEDKVLDGFSIEAEFNEDGSSWAVDPNDDMVRLVSDARLVGTAITSAPAFDDARVSGVAATRNGRNEMYKPEGPNGTEQNQGAPASGLDAESSAAFTAAVEAFTNQTGAFTDAVTKLVEVQQQHAEGPAFVDPTRRTAQFQVNEEPLYRFDGIGGQHDFSSDIIAGSKGDYEAMGRVEQWLQQNFAVETDDASALNPERHRPDLYVDQLQYPTPIWDAIRKGSIPDNTPFVLPKFGSASDLVNDHTEGTEPSSGSFTTTSQTITPSPVSGKVEVNREVWDQGGSPQLSNLIWRQMLRAYDEALEEASADLLENESGVTEIALTAGAVDTELASEVKTALAKLHFTRGGFRFRDLKLEEGLYGNLADASDGNGRPIFPVLGASNSDGTMGSFFGSINIAGLPGVPSWALPFTDGSDNNSYLFDREDVSGWASTPQRLNFEYQIKSVHIGIWGYKALAVTRADGIRRIVYNTEEPA